MSDPRPAPPDNAPSWIDFVCFLATIGASSGKDASKHARAELADTRERLEQTLLNALELDGQRAVAVVARENAKAEAANLRVEIERERRLLCEAEQEAKALREAIERIAAIGPESEPDHYYDDMEGSETYGARMAAWEIAQEARAALAKDRAAAQKEGT